MIDEKNIRDLTVAFLGDSVTEGCFEFFRAPCGFDTVRRPEDGYVFKTEKALRHYSAGRNISCLNLGISGSSAHTAQSQVEFAIAACPNIAVVSFGLNDVLHHPDDFPENLEKIFLSLRQVVPDIIYITPNMMNTYLHDKTLPQAQKIARKTMTLQTNGVFDRMIENARAVCQSQNVTILDVYARWKALADSGIDITDQCLINHVNHPTSEMHELTAEMLFDSISAR